MVLTDTFSYFLRSLIELEWEATVMVCKLESMEVQ